MLSFPWPKPDEIIGDNYMRRWHVLRRPSVLNVYLHRYVGSDDDRALHDHPWRSVGIVLWGHLLEVEAGDKQTRLWPLIPKFRSAEYSHRLVLKSRFAITLFITGKKVREWGFHCPKGWVHWREFTDGTGQKTGVGCGDEDFQLSE